MSGLHKGSCSTILSFLREVVERVLQEMLEAEMTRHIGAAPYERSGSPHTGPRGDSITALFASGRNVQAILGPVGAIRIVGTGTTQNSREMYIEGVSTRKVKEVTEELCGTSFSKSLVSSLAGSLNSELEAWRDRLLEAAGYPYVFVDAREPTRR